MDRSLGLAPVTVRLSETEELCFVTWVCFVRVNIFIYTHALFIDYSVCVVWWCLYFNIFGTKIIP